MSAEDVARLVELEEGREARRRRRNKVLTVLLVVAVLFGAFAIWGVSSQRAANERFDNRQDLSCLYSDRC